MKISEITQCIEKIAPLNIQESYDNCGLLIGHPNDEVNKILLCMDVTGEILQEAIAEKCDLIISHHPMIFFGVKKIDTNSLIYQAIQNKIAIYAAHTNLDSAVFGVSTILGEKLGLENLRTLRKSSVDERFGLGIVGEFITPMNETDFLDLIKKTCQIPIVKHSNLRGKPIKTVALCGGGGSELIQDATAQNVDAFVSSDFKYHEYTLINVPILQTDASRSAEFLIGGGLVNTPILLVDAGHFETEQYAVDILYSEISKNFPTFAVRKTQTKNNFVNYR
ncbi:MAG: Nif3-like dinuclear metal center hexameric protein [Bacteroidales bacterium]|jgi:dinuclear metal center YbgI/SA1388 family protein|nr:Nif3-like dinuclear metal center hexameric protein [Bacteroidales bacterium]